MLSKKASILTAGVAALTLAGCSRPAMNIEHIDGALSEGVAAAAHKNRLGGEQKERFDASFNRDMTIAATLKDIQISHAGDYVRFDNGNPVRSQARYWAIQSNGKTYLLAATNPELPPGQGNAEAAAVLDKAVELSMSPNSTSKQDNIDGTKTHRFLTLQLDVTAKNLAPHVGSLSNGFSDRFVLTASGDSLFGSGVKHAQGSVEEQISAFFQGNTGTVLSVRDAKLIQKEDSK